MSILPALRICACLCLLGLTGCAALAPQSTALREQHPQGLPERAELTGVPFFPQEEHYCGPAALAMVLNAGGVAVSEQELTEQVYLPGRKGSLQIEMLAAARRNGMVAYPLAPRLEDVLREVAAGNPVVVLENYGFSWYPLWHYAVVVGYDLGALEIIRRSGTRPRQIQPLALFEYVWKQEHYWAMVALPPQRLPATANEGDFLAAVVALEQSDQPRLARDGYSTLLARWPHNLVARIGYGNTAYALGDLEQAEAAFRAAARDHPDSAVAFNNLAQTLARRGDFPEALAAARKAVALGGPFAPTARATLDEIERKAPGPPPSR
ncbi:MAG TPA: PA2778 family cysteine peptidase [Burkholderiales bacterium]|nr:PA2778 family cysteine peptidase [Burkholderiales bacterium]